MSDRSGKKRDSRVQSYLVLYNSLQALGWAYIMIKGLIFAIAPTTEATLWETLKIPLLMSQSFAMLEVFHALLKFVSSPPVIVFNQTLARALVLWLGVFLSNKAQNSIGVPIICIAWTLTENVRYPYYVVSLLNIKIGLLEWMRYSLFIVLYPLGLFGELTCYYNAATEFANTKQYSLDHPNRWNFSFQIHYVISAVMVIYSVVFIKMYLHMHRQRKKVLGKHKKH